MRIAYIILAHQNPGHLLRLVNTLSTDNSQFVIHIDKREKLAQFKRLFPSSQFNNVYFIRNRCIAIWGNFQIVEATLNCLKFARNNLPLSERVIILSGLDYPIKNKKFIESYLKNNPFKIYMQYFRMPHPYWQKGGLNRFPHYEKIDEVIKIYGGSQWISFPFNVIEIIFDFLKFNPDFISYFKVVRIPDESFFQTLLLNCDQLIVTENITNKNLHLIKWDPPYLHPRILTATNFNTIKRSKSLFARKFDENASSILLDKIDNEILLAK